MNYSRNIRKKMQRHKKMNRKQRLSFTALAVLLILVCCFSIKTNSSASADTREKCYKSIKIQSGDSLWSIAEQYYTDDWDNMPVFIEEIKCFNGIVSDRIHAGNYIAIPYYQD